MSSQAVAVVVDVAKLIVEFEYHARLRRQFSNQRQRRRINYTASSPSLYQFI